ncbi:MAG: PilZ domain-containing protein [Candidatus Omnitrophica bacterium]|nr:PilZ domain-containing protein [Candidatus Omnitrophota bacterium]
MDNKRKFMRLERTIPVRQRPKKSGNIESTKAENISAGGLRIATDSSLDVGSKIDIEVDIPGAGNPYYAIGEVVWLKEKKMSSDKKFDMGIRFVRIVTKADLDGF